jgi:iron complex outermembrane receptor protein
MKLTDRTDGGRFGAARVPAIHTKGLPMARSIQILALHGCALSALAVNPALAAPQAAGAKDAMPLEEVVVTARKRVENLQDVPVSITAVSAQEISERGSVRVRDLASSIPNFVFTGPQDNSAPLVTVRGIQSQARVNVGFDSGMGVYVDGVVQGRPIGFNQELMDVERVEFLRGPQGTLFGKNSISGAISVTTRRPSEEFTGEARAEVGSDGLRAGNVYVSGPLGERVLFSASAFRRERDGYVENLATGRRVDNDDSIGARAKLLVKATDDLEFTLAGDIVSDDSVTTSARALSGYGAVPKPYQTNVDKPTLAARDLSSVSLTVDWKVAGGTVTSISAYGQMERDRTNDTDAGPLNVVSSKLTNDQDQFTQEIRFTSGTSGVVSYIAGLYYFRQDINSFGQSCFGPITNVPAFLRGLCGDTSGDITTTSKAVFANADWRISDALTFTGGLRYTKEEKELDYLQNGFPFGVAPTLPRQKDRVADNDLSPTVSLLWKATPDVNIYGTVSRGFKSGGWNLDNITSNSITRFSQLRFTAESAWNYEIGAKTTWLDNRLTFNAALYRIKYEELQAVQLQQVLGGGGAVVAVVSNAANARSQGAELELVARPSENLLITAGLGYADAKYTDYIDRTAGGAALNFSGNRLDNAPKWTRSASIQYTLPAGALRWRFRGDWNMRSDYFFGRENLVAQRLAGWSTGNLQVSVGNADQSWELTAFADNVTDREYIVAKGSGGFPFPGVGTSETVTYGTPRQIGVRASLRF